MPESCERVLAPFSISISFFFFRCLIIFDIFFFFAPARVKRLA